MIYLFRQKHGAILFALFLLFLICFLSASLIAPHEPIPFDNEQTALLNEGWMYTDANGVACEVSLPTRIAVDPEQVAVISRTLPGTLGSPVVLCFRSSQQQVRVTLDEQEVYTFGTEENLRLFGKSSGSAWNLVRLTEDYAGKTVSIELTSPYKVYSGVFSAVRVGSKASLLYDLIHTYAYSFAIMVLIFLIGAGTLLLYLFLFQKNEAGEALVYLGGFGILVSIWLFGETKLIQFFIENQFFVLSLTFVCLLTFPILIIGYIGCIVGFRYKKWTTNMMRVLCAHTIVVCVLQALNIYDFIEMLPIIHVVLGVVCVVTLCAMMIDWKRNGNRNIRPIIFSLTPLLFFCIVEIIWLYNTNSIEVGGFLQLGVLVFIVAQAGMAMRQGQKILLLSRAATLDALTGCKNRTAYIHRLKELEGNENVAVAMVDLNLLKVINDRLGHEMGDDALIRCARCFTHIFKEYGACYRIGGDEFLFASGAMHEQQIKELTESFQQICAQENSKAPYFFSVAIGYAVFDRGKDRTLSDTVRRADQAMYQDKKRQKQHYLKV